MDNEVDDADKVDVGSLCYGAPHQAKLLIANPAPLTPDALESMMTYLHKGKPCKNVFLLEQLLFAALRTLQVEKVRVIVQHKLMTPDALNRRHVYSEYNSDSVSYLCCACVAKAETLAQTQAKVQCVDSLLDAGAINVNAGYYLMGESGPTPLQTLFYEHFWPRLDDAERLRLVQRMLAVGGNIRYRPHSLARTALMLAEKNFPHLVPYLPTTLEPDGQQHTLLPRESGTDWMR
ncbi:MAG: hypothetical protein WAX89_00065 [Alphaproteobacteria bacterium]